MAYRIRRSHFIEAAVALTVIAVLFAVTLPKFHRAQVRTRVTQAQQDLMTLAAAMESYALDWPNAVVRSLTMDGNNYPNMRTKVQAFIELDGNDALWSILALNQTAFAAYLETVPVPQPYFELPSREERNGTYSIRWHGSVSSWRADEFGAGDMTGYIATALCPAARVSGSSEGDDAGFYYVEYSPSNGLVSHGFTVVRTPSEVSPSHEDVDRRARAWWKEQEANQQKSRLN